MIDFCWCGLRQVFQRQLSKEGLQQVVNNSGAGGSASGEEGGINAAAMSSEDLRDLFTLRAHSRSDTYDSMCADIGDEAEEEAACSQEGGDGAAGAGRAEEEVNKEQARLLLHLLVPLLIGLVDGAMVAYLLHRQATGGARSEQHICISLQ
jgi:hypothetical protein